MHCENCNKELLGKKKGTKYCDGKCRKEAFDKRSAGTDLVTDNFVVDEPVEEREFKFTIKIGPRDEKNGTAERKSKVRTAKYWYDVPLAAVPVISKGDPEMPEWMDGRQYFLWWKNDFKVSGDKPVIFNPYPKARGEIKYEMGGETARRWGA
jgi:hypothetical protein